MGAARATRFSFRIKAVIIKINGKFLLFRSPLERKIVGGFIALSPLAILAKTPPRQRRYPPISRTTASSYGALHIRIFLRNEGVTFPVQTSVQYLGARISAVTHVP